MKNSGGGGGDDDDYYYYHNSIIFYSYLGLSCLPWKTKALTKNSWKKKFSDRKLIQWSSDSDLWRDDSYLLQLLKLPTWWEHFINTKVRPLNTDTVTHLQINEAYTIILFSKGLYSFISLRAREEERPW